MWTFNVLWEEDRSPLQKLPAASRQRRKLQVSKPGGLLSGLGIQGWHRPKAKEAGEKVGEVGAEAGADGGRQWRWDALAVQLGVLGAVSQFHSVCRARGVAFESLRCTCQWSLLINNYQQAVTRWMAAVLLAEGRKVDCCWYWLIILPSFSTLPLFPLVSPNPFDSTRRNLHIFGLLRYRRLHQSYIPATSNNVVRLPSETTTTPATSTWRSMQSPSLDY